MNKRLFTSVFFLVSLCLIVGQSYACPILKAVISPPKPKWVHQGYTISFSGYSSLGSIVGCTWSLPPEAYDITYHTHWYPDDIVSCKFSTPGVYTVTLTVTDSEQRTDSDMCLVNVVAVNMVPGSHDQPYPNVYIAFNYDDDDSDGVPDRDQGGTVAGEDDLFEIQLSVAPTDLPGEVELTVDSYEGSLKVWSDPDKQNLIIPNGTPPSYYARWSPAELPPLLYVEGFDGTLVWDAWLRLCYVAPDLGLVYPWDEADFTVVEVDVDMDGVKDWGYQWPEVTEEITPGGFIALNDDDDNNNEIPDKDEDGPVSGEDDLVKITLRRVSPTNLTGNVTLKKVPSDSTKIKIWENETKGGTPLSLPAIYATPSDLPEELWVEGFEVSSGPRDIELTMQYGTFEDKINVTVVEVEVIATPEYLFASADYATPISFQVLGLGGEVHIHDIQAKLYLNGNLAKTIPIGQRFVASDPTIPSSGFNQENETTYKYTGYVRASEYSTISLGDAHRTDDAYFMLRVLASEVMPLGQLGPAVWVDSSLNDEKMDLFVDKDIFAVEPGIPGVHTAGAREYTNVPINSGTQTAVHKEGKKSMQHWEINTPDILPGTCCDTSEIHEHDYCGYGPYPSYPPFYVDIYENPCWFWNDCPQDITTSSSQMSLYTRLYSTGGEGGNGFKNRIYGRRRGGYFYMSYGGKALASDILDADEYAMDLSKTGGDYDWELFATGNVRFTNKQENSGGLNAGAASGAFGIAAALAAPISIPWAVAFGTVAGAFGIIEAVDTDSGAIDKKAEGVLYRCLVRHRFGFDPVTEKDVLLRDYDGSGSWIAADCSKVGKSINVGDQYTFFAEIESVCSAKTPNFFDVDVSQTTEYKCNTSDDFNYMRILISE